MIFEPSASGLHKTYHGRVARKSNGFTEFAVREGLGRCQSDSDDTGMSTRLGQTVRPLQLLQVPQRWQEIGLEGKTAGRPRAEPACTTPSPCLPRGRLVSA